MKLYLMCSKELHTINLPSQINDSVLFSFNIKDIKDNNQLVIEAEDNNWVIKSNGSVDVLSNNIAVDKVQIKENQMYSLVLSGTNHKLLLWSSSSIEKSSTKLSFNNLSEIFIGNSDTDNICFNNPMMFKNYTILKKDERGWYITANEKSLIYVNDVRIKSAYLQMGDILFINGLIIIWMNNFIQINNPNNAISVKNIELYSLDNTYDNTNYGKVSDIDANIELYKDEDYFYQTPKLQNSTYKELIVIDPAPPCAIKEELPFFLSLGASFTMFSSTLVMGLSTLMSYFNKTRTLMQCLPQFVMMFCMIIGAVLLPMLTKKYQKKKRIERENLRIKKYGEYLAKKEKELNDIVVKQKQMLEIEYPFIEECVSIMSTSQKNNMNFWSREIKNNNFLALRLGKGEKPVNIEIKAPEEKFTLDEDEVQAAVYNIVNHNKTLENVPITLNLTNDISFGIFGNYGNRKEYFNSLLFQLMVLHSPANLKIVVLTNEENEHLWNYCKYSPHCLSEDKTTRFFATNQSEINEICLYLEQTLKERKSLEEDEEIKEEEFKTLYKKYDSYFLIITDDYKHTNEYPFINELLNEQINYGFSIISIANNFKDLSNKIKTFVDVGDKKGSILGNDINNHYHQVFSPELVLNLNMQNLCAVLSNIPISTAEKESILPSSLSFLDMYDVGKIEQLNIVNRWKVNNPVTSLSTPIGVHKTGELFKLDLHEKFHGPHGLIAGSTGSGKSEFIITYILSLAINYHPYEVQFVLIDYKGGGLAGAFENKETGMKIPHLTGTITNLDKSEMNRSLVSIESELKRRQVLFNNVRDKLGESTIDIYKYQKLYREGQVEEPLAHLFIISDEFAELKSQQPDFMQQLISTARIGRSLGIHLILATQKPTGVVNDQIWSNSKFKICLKVQNKSDSMEMLKRPEAASIKETGRFYLQVGYDDYFDIGQSAWGGAKYTPNDTIIKKIDDSINFINNTGYILKTINDYVKVDESKNYGDQLTNIVKYISNTAKRDNIVTKQLWLDAISDTIYLYDIKNKYSYKAEPYFINPVIGEFDNPKEQSQGLLTLNITSGENVVIFGQSGSGKENLISTIIISTVIDHTPEEVNIYILDFGSEVLQIFRNFPHVGDVITQDSKDKLIDLFALINDEIETRKEKYLEFGGNYNDYCKQSGKKDPIIMVFINAYDVFSETYVKYAEILQPFYRDGNKYGINFIISTTATNAVRGRTLQSFSTMVALQLQNPGDYRDLLNCPKGLVPASYFGRGLIGRNGVFYEFQTSLIYKKDEINSTIKNISEKLNSSYKIKAKKVPTIPEVVDFEFIKDKITDIFNIPIGVGMVDKNVLLSNFIERNLNIVLSNNIDNIYNYIDPLLRILTSINETTVNVVDFYSKIEENIANINYFNSNFEGFFNNIKEEEKPKFSFIIGAGSLREKIKPKDMELVTNIFSNILKYKNNYFILLDNYNNFKKLQLELWYQANVDSTNGIWLGDGVANQNTINFSNLSLEQRRINDPSLGIISNKGQIKFFKYVTKNEVKNEK